MFEANDILLGLADIPSFLFSSPEALSSTELTDGFVPWLVVAVVDNVDVLVGLRAVDVVVGRAGGLLRELLPLALAAEAVVEGREEVDSLGAEGFVTGLGVALDDLNLESSVLEGACLSMLYGVGSTVDQS